MKSATLRKVTLSMGGFHVFQIVQVVPIRAKHHISSLSLANSNYIPAFPHWQCCNMFHYTVFQHITHVEHCTKIYTAKQIK